METAALPIEQVPSRGVHPKVRTAARLDPYWDGLWSSGSMASWLNIETASRQVRAGLGTVPARMDIDPEQAWEQFTSGHTWRRKLEMLGTVLSWRTLAAEQLAAFVGAPSLANTSQVMNSAYASGLLDVGIFASGLVRTSASGTARLYRPSRSNVFDSRLAPMLTYPEQVLVTGGGKYRSGGQWDRHNLLTAELALRAAEFCTIGTVLGEMYASIDSLAGSGIGRTPIRKRNMSADTVIVRPDGLRVAVEVTASVTNALREKVTRWCEHLAQASLGASGLTVMFVCAPPPDRGYHRGDFVNQVRTLIKQVVSKFLGGRAGERVADRVMVSAWEDYFPAPGMVHPDFFTLRAWRTQGRTDSAWEAVDSLDEFDFGFEAFNPEALQAILSGQVAIASAPVWLRRGAAPPPVHSVHLHQAGVNNIPIPPPRRSDRRVGFDPDARRGPGSIARLAPRLRSVPTDDEPH